MPRGGVRSGAGARGKWKHGKTKMIRVPEVLADQILQYAHNLDEGAIIESVTESNNNRGSSFDSVAESKSIDLSGTSIRLCNGKSAVYLEDLVKAGYDLYPQRLGQIFKNVVASRFQK